MDRQTYLTAKRFANRLKKHMKIDQLILFGSRARRDNFVTSDFDFVIVSDVFSAIPFVKRASRLYQYWQERADLEALCYTKEEWSRMKNKRGILLNAQQHGIRLA